MRRLLMAALGLCMAGAATAQPAPPTAAETDPVAMGWMQGTPPAAERTIRVVDGSHFNFPQWRWSFSNWQQLFPTVPLRTAGTPSPLPRAIRTDLDAVTFTPTGGSTPMTWAQAFDANFMDGVIVLHRGRVVHERHAPILGPDGRHIAWSVTKSFVGLLAEALIAEGVLDEARTAASYVPELAGAGHGDATVRQLLDMRTGVAFSEIYGDPESDISRHAIAGGLFLPPPGAPAPEGFLAFLTTLPRAGPHGGPMVYRTADTDALAWVIARATGRPVATLFEERFWKPMGMAHEAVLVVDGVGTPFFGGGLNLALADLARFGEMVRLGGTWNGQRIVPAAAIASIRGGGDRAAFPAGHPTLKGWSYRSKWWVSHDASGTFMGRGVHGQHLWIDPKAEVVIARFGSHPSAANTAFDGISLPAYRALADHLAQGR
jgi:CubicO group peptidase (beta-lactamase class C family)